MELLIFALILNNNDGFAIGALLDLEGPQFHIFLHDGVVELSADQTLGVEHCVHGVSGHLVLGRVAYQTLGFGETHVGWGRAVTLIIGNDFNTVVHPNSDTGVSGSKIYTDANSFNFFFLRHLIDWFF